MSRQTGSGAPGLRPCKRYIATHTPEGKSIYADSPDQSFNSQPGVGGMARSYAITSVPGNLTNDADLKAYKAEEGPASYLRPEIVPKEPGTSLLVIDLEPGAVTMMHRTVSIDYSICCIGEIDHELDGGEKVRLLPGVSILFLFLILGFEVGVDS
jgi:hypothetical protein